LLLKYLLLQYILCIFASRNQVFLKSTNIAINIESNGETKQAIKQAINQTINP